jgi:cytochrome c5
MITRHLIFGLLVLVLVSVLTVTAQQNSAPASQQSASSGKQKRTVQAQNENEGERIFQEHCSRCHAAPEGFSPRISGTIVRHMRVRASLSQHEEEELLHYFNP